MSWEKEEAIKGVLLSQFPQWVTGVQFYQSALRGSAGPSSELSQPRGENTGAIHLLFLSLAECCFWGLLTLQMLCALGQACSLGTENTLAVKGLYRKQASGHLQPGYITGEAPSQVTPSISFRFRDKVSSTLPPPFCVSEAQFFPDYILALLSSIPVLDLGIMALEYIKGSQESELISV